MMLKTHWLVAKQYIQIGIEILFLDASKVFHFTTLLYFYFGYLWAVNCKQQLINLLDFPC